MSFIGFQSRDGDMSDQSAKPRGKIKKAIANAAPTLAHALGGPLAGAAVAQLSRVIFGVPDTDEETLSEAIGHMTPVQVLALKNAEREFAVALRELNVEEHRIDAADRDSARQRQMAMADWTPTLLGALIILGFFGVLCVMVARRLPIGAESEFSIMLGALATMTAAVVNYFFGSSSGSKEKTRLLGNGRQRREQSE